MPTIIEWQAGVVAAAGSPTVKTAGQELQAGIGYQPPLSLYAVDGRPFYNSDHDITLNFTGNGFELRTGEIPGLKFERNKLRK